MTEHRINAEHAALLDRMGQALGLDLEEEAIAGRMPFDEIADSVLRCKTCGTPQACKRWLDRIEGSAEVASATPNYCRNKELLSELLEMQR
ncbi:DUF6455 family protein [Epibacterium ulvae]|uniref:DUF6455 family protein n=1 Tax=Epibacterium ulvae TaxID=1156985 RepID=UPI002490AABD|nr:DUF6455 family protein [Epibacterium ulvae]